MAWNLHSRDEHVRRGDVWVYWTFRCNGCRAWCVIPNVGGQPTPEPCVKCRAA